MVNARRTDGATTAGPLELRNVGPMTDGEGIEPEATANASTIEDLYVNRRDQMYRLAFLLVHDPQDAEDIVHEAFARMAGVNPGAGGFRSPEAYLRSTVFNLARSSMKRTAHRRDAESRSAKQANTNLRGKVLTPEDETVVRDEQRELLARVWRLSPRQRLVVVSRYWLGLSDTEISNETGMSLGSVKTQLRRAKRHLSEEIVEWRG